MHRTLYFLSLFYSVIAEVMVEDLCFSFSFYILPPKVFCLTPGGILFRAKQLFPVGDKCFIISE